MPWEQLQGYLQENRSDKRAFEQEPPVACPFDGEPLDVHPDGRRNCPMGNYTYTGGPKLI